MASVWIPSAFVARVAGESNHAKDVDTGRRSEGQGMTGWEAPFQRAWVLPGTASFESAVVEATSEACGGNPEMPLRRAGG